MSATRLLVLGGVRIYGRAHGYRLGVDLLSWGVEQWANVKWGSIYHALRKLASEGLLTATQFEKWPGRVDYEITARGEAEFFRLLRDALKQPNHHPEMLAAGVAMLPALTRDEAVALLRARLATLEQERGEIVSALDQPGPSDLPSHIAELYCLWMSFASSQVEWTRGLIERLENGAYVMAGEDGHPFGTSGTPHVEHP
ncbi:MAG: PadR family transcriptional regulator [Dehalococcoidia bacterium]